MSKSRKTRELSWKPRRRGDIYCSPACGNGCTYVEYLEANLKAAALCKRIGMGYKPNVWENLKWCFNAVSPCGRIRVHEFTYRDSSTKRTITNWTAYLGDPNPGGRWVGVSDKSPLLAIKQVILTGRKELSNIAELLDGLTWEPENAARP